MKDYLLVQDQLLVSHSKMLDDNRWNKRQHIIVNTKVSPYLIVRFVSQS